jgi:hypothetical protein
MARKLWHLGNTTVRSPFRLRDGLVALSSSSLEGNLHGRTQEVAFRKLLGEKGIVELGNDETYSVGRKWRSALNKLGFVVPELTNVLGPKQSEIGSADNITENGKRLIGADTVPAMQECFLRALTAYVIPNPGESYDFPVFSPLKFVLAILLMLEKSTSNGSLSFIEIALFVIPNSPADNLESIVKNIIEFRSTRDRAQNKMAFDNQARNKLAAELDYVSTTFDDYADTTIRYLKATGLVVAKGRGLILYEERKSFVRQLVADISVSGDAIEYYGVLCRGASLPTDELPIAIQTYRDANSRARSLGISMDTVPESLLNIADINARRYRIEEKIFQAEEEIYALKQAELVDEIIEYMDILISNRRNNPNDEGAIYIPNSERPAYLEWIFWRAFLSINHLKNKPYEARRFKIDQSFLPIGCAPGNGPDLVFEFEDFVLVVEVTLTENSRQEAAEGETVRRHVADMVVKYPSKEVYGLFIAKNINTNTAQTFRMGMWYTNGDIQLELEIVPITLAQFKVIYIALLTFQKGRPEHIKRFLDDCIVGRSVTDAPGWKTQISEVVTTFNTIV